MECEFKCKVLEAIFEPVGSFLGGPIKVSCEIKVEPCYHLIIEQCGTRHITITADEEVSVFELNSILTKVERLLMIFCGYFVPLKELKFLQSSIFTDKQLVSPARNLKSSRLSYFSTDKRFRLHLT